MEWKNLYRGAAMGISDLIPGVSGGTIAFVLGIYEQLLAAISGFFSREWKKHLAFLIPLGIGMAGTILSLSRAIEYLLAHYFEPTQFFFLGLIIGVVPFMVKQANVKETFKASHLLVLLAAVLLLAWMAFVNPGSREMGSELAAGDFVLLFFSGWLASMAMLLPGISGSFLLLLIGVYPVVINALSTFNVPVIAAVGAGVMLGFVISSKAIRFALSHFPYMTYALIIGLILGSIFTVFPGIPASGSAAAASVVTFVLGLGLTYEIGKKEPAS